MKGQNIMLLALDVGNTNITIGVYDAEKLLFVSRMATDQSRMEDQYAIELLDILKIYGVSSSAVDGAIVSSVVPKLTSYIKKAIRKIFNIEAIVVSAGLVPELQVKGGTADSLGADLIVGCLAAKELYSCPNIVVDMGTATTLFVMDKDAYVLGGCILPGVGVSLDALTSRTAQLPSISLEAPEKVIGKDTVNCMRSGIMYGAASMIDGLCERIEEELGYKCTVIATGGLAESVVKNCRRKDIVFSDTLLLEGLKLIYEKNKG